MLRRKSESEPTHSAPSNIVPRILRFLFIYLFLVDCILNEKKRRLQIYHVATISPPLAGSGELRPGGIWRPLGFGSLVPTKQFQPPPSPR